MQVSIKTTRLPCYSIMELRNNFSHRALMRIATSLPYDEKSEASRNAST